MSIDYLLEQVKNAHNDEVNWAKDLIRLLTIIWDELEMSENTKGVSHKTIEDMTSYLEYEQWGIELMDNGKKNPYAKRREYPKLCL